MLKLVLETEYFNEETMEFEQISNGTYLLEHSLKSISEWEAKYKKPFLSQTKHELEEMLDYYAMMCIGESFNIEDLTVDDIKKIAKYIEDPQTATTIKSTGGGSNRSIITSEVIYAMMVDADVPFECDIWNLKRLLTLINVISVRRNPKKMSQDEIYRQNTELNNKRRQAMKNRG